MSRLGTRAKEDKSKEVDPQLLEALRWGRAILKKDLVLLPEGNFFMGGDVLKLRELVTIPAGSQVYFADVTTRTYRAILAKKHTAIRFKLPNKDNPGDYFEMRISCCEPEVVDG